MYRLSPSRALRFTGALALLALATTGCDTLFGPGGETYDVVTRFEEASVPAAAPGVAVLADRAFTDAALDLQNEVCGGGIILCLTPSTLGGRIYSGGLMVGGSFRNGPGLSLTTIGASTAVIEEPNKGKGGSLTFDVASTTDLSGGYICCDGPISYPTGEDAVISRIELNFDYVDMTFTVPAEAGTELVGQTFTLRLVYVDEATAPDVDGTMLMGDKLVRRAGEDAFRWCDQASCDHATRPASGVLQAANIQPPQDSHGNPHYSTFVIPLGPESWVPFSEDDATQGNWMFHVAFDLTGAAVFEMGSWSEMASEWAIVEAFNLLHDSGQGHSSVRVRLSKESIPTSG